MAKNKKLFSYDLLLKQSNYKKNYKVCIILWILEEKEKYNVLRRNHKASTLLHLLKLFTEIFFFCAKIYEFILVIEPKNDMKQHILVEILIKKKNISLKKK